MKPSSDFLLRSIAKSLATDIFPQVESRYHQLILKQIIELVVGIAADFDGAAARIIEENAEIRRLFNDAALSVTDNNLKERLEKAANSVEGDYKISGLDKSNQDLTRLLIELHAHVEILEGDESRSIEEAIKQALMMKSMRRLAVVMEVAGAAELMEGN